MREKAKGYSTNRAKVVTESQPRIARLLAIQGTLKRVPFSSTEDTSSTEDLYVNLRISNHNQTFSDALNVLLAFSHTLLSLYKQGCHFLSALLQLLFSRGGTGLDFAGIFC